MSDNLEERLHDLSVGTGSKTPLAALDRIEELESERDAALKRATHAEEQWGKCVMALLDAEEQINGDLTTEVVDVEDHEDGSATYTFDMPKAMAEMCGNLGLKLLLFCGAAGKSTDFVFDMVSEMIEENTNA